MVDIIIYFTAEKITESLTELAKQVIPSAIAPVAGIRKAMGIVPEPLPVSPTSTPGSSSTSVAASTPSSSMDTSQVLNFILKEVT